MQSKMEAIAEVLVNIPARSINKPFSYLIPAELDFLQAGWRVIVPFGSRQAEGFIVALQQRETEQLDDNVQLGKLKYIISALDEYAWFDQHMLATAKWLSQYYLTSLTDALRLFIPGKSGISLKLYYRINEEEQLNRHTVPAEVKWLLAFIASKGTVSSQQIKRYALLNKLTGADVEQALRYLQKHKLISTDRVAGKKSPLRQQLCASLAIPVQTVAAEIEKLTAKPAQRRLLADIAAHAQYCLTAAEMTQKKLSRSALKQLVANGLLVVSKVSLADTAPVLSAQYQQEQRESADRELTREQQQALYVLLPAIESGLHQSFLLYGITGSGKTQIYIEAVAAVRCSGRQAIVLVPEIALTGQIVARFQARFGVDVTVIHSRLSEGERAISWRRLRSGEAGIVIGARSAVFAPVNSLGIIIIDEEHEFTYKQEESPRYHAREVALSRCRLSGAVTIMGSATPSLETYYQALNDEHTMLTLTKRINLEPLPAVTVVDMREELKAKRRSVISLPLQNLLMATLAKGEQAIIMLNRRGYATFVLCRECGHVMKCPHCDISLVYHAVSQILRCHYCLKEFPVPQCCPHCGSRYIKYFGTGTQKAEEELRKLIPTARIIRMDQDTTGRKTAHADILSAFSRGEYDILLGTQMVAKGHDIKNVTAVGIIAADTALNLPDFRAAEKTFSLLTQVAGRAGRGDKVGHVVLQTYNPEHYAVRYGAAHNYSGFYHEELANRRELSYPPFSQLLKITVSMTDETAAWKKADLLYRQLIDSLPLNGRSEVIGPYPASIGKVNDVFRIHILIKTNVMPIIKEKISQLGIPWQSAVTVDVEPINSI